MDTTRHYRFRDKLFFVLLLMLALSAGWRYLKYRVEAEIHELTQPRRAENSQREANWLYSQSPSAAPTTSLQDDDTVITLRRTGCFGTCPAYSVSIDSSGRVTFVGESYVCESHPSPIFIDRAAVAQLVNGLKSVNFETMPSYAHKASGDLPTATIAFKQANATHVVKHDYEDHAAPVLLDWIENRIDEVSKTSLWLGGIDGSHRICVLPDGTRRPITYSDSAPSNFGGPPIGGPTSN